MIVGYLSKDGKIYDKNGVFVGEFSLEGENIIERDEKFYLGGLVKRTGKITVKSIFEKGYCELILTNKRLLFIREIKFMEKASLHPFFLTALAEGLKARELRKMGLKEYLEISLKEIKYTKKGIFGARNIILEPNGVEYTIMFSKSKKGTLENLFQEM